MKNVLIFHTLFVAVCITSSCSKSFDCDFIGEWCIDYGLGPCVDPRLWHNDSSRT